MKQLTLLFIFQFYITLFSFNTTGNMSQKAILIVGPSQESTPGYIKELDSIGSILLRNNIEVIKFYDSLAIWSEIKKEAKDASYFIYAGHGSNQGLNGGVGGLVIDSIISAKRMINELHFDNNPLIIFKSVCNGAGSSASDDYDIGFTEAMKRVKSYSDCFFKMGARAYLAINYNHGVNVFLNHFFNGENIDSCYSHLVNIYGNKIEKQELIGKQYKVAISSRSPSGVTSSVRTTYRKGKKYVEKLKPIKSYSIAYASIPNFSIENFKD